MGTKKGLPLSIQARICPLPLWYRALALTRSLFAPQATVVEIKCVHGCSLTVNQQSVSTE